MKSCGVPQDSVLSPLLFLIYINDITKASSFHTTSFADDIDLHMSNSCSNVLQTTVNLELCKIDRWLRANKLSLNSNKTNFMLLTSRKHNPASIEVTTNNHSISPENNLKYLGEPKIPRCQAGNLMYKKQKHSYQELVEFIQIKHHTSPPVLKVVFNTLASGWYWGFSQKKPPKHTWLCTGISPLLFGLWTWSKCQKTQQVFQFALKKYLFFVMS